MKQTGRSLVSKRTIYVAVTLAAIHAIAQAYVVSRHVLYDQGGFEGLLWWLIAFFVLPAFALLTLAFSAVRRWIEQTNASGE